MKRKGMSLIKYNNRLRKFRTKKQKWRIDKFNFFIYMSAV